MSTSTSTKTCALIGSASEQSTCTAQPSQWKQALVIIGAGSACMIFIFALTVSAFTAVPEDIGPNPGNDNEPDDETTSELSAIVQAIVIGWTFCLAATGCKTHAAAAMSSASNGLRSAVSRVQTYVAASKEILVIIGAAVICMLPIIVLIVSAFTASPDEEPGNAGVASESSSIVRAFTMGWMVCLAVKLCRELVGLVGLSSCAALLSC